jgi:hypothetical protein
MPPLTVGLDYVTQLETQNRLTVATAFCKLDILSAPQSVCNDVQKLPKLNASCSDALEEIAGGHLKGLWFWNQNAHSSNCLVHLPTANCSVRFQKREEE